MKTKLIVYPLLCAAMLFACSCGKDGPAGPQGEQGVAGETDAQGPKGDKGSTGTANVIYSEWFKPTAYTKTTVYGIYNFNADKSAPKITQEIINSGVLLTYGKLEGYNSNFWPTGQVSQLPVTLIYKSGGVQIDTWAAYPTVGNLRITFTNSTNEYVTLATGHSFRYIIIPHGVAARKSSPPPDYKDYHAVCEYYGIQE